MTSAKVLSTSPYYDDFDEDKVFVKVLFKPSLPVQTRELNQLGSILQNQIARFGENVFKEGSIVVPGGITIDTNYEYVKLQETDIDSAIVGDTLTGQTSNNTAELVQKVEVDGSDPATFYIRYKTGGRFTDGESIVVSGTGSGTFTAAASSSTGKGTKVDLDKGVFFVKGYFAAAVTQKLIIEKYGTPTGEVEVGLKVDEQIISSDSDSTLLDNANGTNNVNAPGADRLKLNLSLAKKSDLLDSDGDLDDVDYISLALIFDGTIVEKYLTSQYNILGDELARRTYDESGNYTIDPFIAEVTEHATSPSTKFNMSLDPGVAYVRGYEVRKNLSTSLDLDKALDTEIRNNGKISCAFGNYVRTSAPTHLPNISTFAKVDLNDSSTTKIGEARVRAVSKEGSYYRFYLFDVVMNASKAFNQVRVIEDGTFTATLIGEDNSSLSTDNAQLYGTSQNTLLFNAPFTRVKEFTDITARVQRRATGTTNGSGELTLDSGDSNISWENTSSWVVVRNDTGAVVTPTYGSTGSQTIQLSGLTNSTAHTIIGFVDKTTASTNARTKTLTTVTSRTITPDGDDIVFLEDFDIYDITSVIDDADSSDITDSYFLDNGQRDNFYEEGRLILKNGATAPTGDVTVTFRYFEHGATGAYFNVDSYDSFVSSNSYADIPTHTLSNGTTVRLADAFDFRPRRDDANTGFSGSGSVINELPQVNSTIQADIEYFLPRIDMIYLDQTGNFGIVKGASALNPKAPVVPAIAMSLYSLYLNAGSLSITDMRLSFVENKRYTMRDIGRIEKRIDRLEEWSTLSLLEADTNSLEVLDADGNARFRSGFFVDGFKNHAFTDTSNLEHRSALDPISATIRPGFIENNARLVYRSTASDGSASSGVVKKGDFILLNYSEATEIKQGLATDSINVNPYAVIVQVGDITLSPESDEWRDVETTTRNVTITEDADINPVQNFNWNNWGWNWAGRWWNNADGGREFAETDFTFTSTPGSITTSSETRVLSVTLLPFMRSRKVYFYARGLLPSTTHKAFFAGVDVTDFCREETFTRISDDDEQGSTSDVSDITAHPDGTTDLISNSNGEIQGSFYIPNTSSRRFIAGTKEFKLRDEDATLDSNSISRGYASFTSQGTLETRETTVTTTIIRPIPQPVIRPIDPVAQSFVIDRPEGAFVTSVDVCFQSKDSTAPVRLEIRPMEVGLPLSYPLPGAQKWLNPSEVNVEANSPNLNTSSDYTTFTFDEPVYLEGNREYAIVVLSDSVGYNIWTAVVGNFRTGSTTQRVMKQPTLGSFFKSQNGSTWTPDQNRDLMFRLKRANFTSTSGSAYFENVASIPRKRLANNPLEFTNSSATIRVRHPNHGLFTGSTTTIAGASGTINGVPSSEINANHTVTVDTLDTYSITVSTSATSTGRGGSTTITATENYTYNEAFFNANAMTLPSTRAEWSAKTTSGKSVAGSEQPYIKDSSFVSIAPNDQTEFDTVRTIPSAINSSTSMSSARGLTVKVDLTTSNSLVSPVIDLQRMSMSVIGNRIDRPASSAATGFNVPNNFVAETATLTTNDSTLQSAAKHITSPVTLEEPAVGLRLIAAVNRPADSYFDVYYKVLTSGSDTSFTDIDWTLATIDEDVQTDDDSSTFRDYVFTIEEDQFTSFVFKFVFTGSNSSSVPRVRDIRAIALTN